MKVLIIDDDPLTLITLSKMVESKGGTVLRARDGFEGLNIALKQQPELVISDVFMPFVSGVELWNILKEFTKINVCLMSSFSEGNLQQLEQKFDTMKYLHKPVSMYQMNKLMTDLNS